MWHRRRARTRCGAMSYALETSKARAGFSSCPHCSLRCAMNIRAAAVEPGMAPNCHSAAIPLQAKTAVNLRMRRVISILMSRCPSAMGLYASKSPVVVPLGINQILRRHKLPTPHLALWPTEVHVVMRGKVCEKGCYFLGTQTPLVATCKNKVCISNICYYLHFWKHTDFQNKDIQSPKYSVVLHLDHCIPVCVGGGGLPIFLSPLFEVDH